MVKFKCVSCDKEYFDMNLYFYDKPSIKCLWCNKYPQKDKKVKQDGKVVSTTSK